MLLRQGIRLWGHWRPALPIQRQVAGASPIGEECHLNKVGGHATLLRDRRPKLDMSLIKAIDTGLDTREETAMLPYLVIPTVLVAINPSQRP